MDLSLLHLAQHRPGARDGARDAASPSSMPVKPDLDSSSSIASTSSIGGPTHSYSRHPAFPRGDDANFVYRKLNGERSPSNGDEPLRKKQKRNKPTLSCHECVERKTKVSMFLIVRITAIFSLGAVSSSSGFLLVEDRPLCVVFGTVHIMPFLHEFFWSHHALHCSGHWGFPALAVLVLLHDISLLPFIPAGHMYHLRGSQPVVVFSKYPIQAPSQVFTIWVREIFFISPCHN